MQTSLNEILFAGAERHIIITIDGVEYTDGFEAPSRSRILTSNKDLKFGTVNASCFKVTMYGIADVTGKSISVREKVDGYDSDVQLFTGIIESADLQANRDNRLIIAYDKIHDYADNDVAMKFKALFPTSQKADYKGEWNANTVYVTPQVVTYNGLYYQYTITASDTITVDNKAVNASTYCKGKSPADLETNAYTMSCVQEIAYTPVVYGRIKLKAVRDMLLADFDVDNVTLPNDNLEITYNGQTQLTWIDLLQNVLELNARFGTIDASGRFKFVTLGAETADYTGNIASGTTYSEYSCPVIDNVIVYAADATTAYERGDGTNTYTIDNNLCYGANCETMVNNIYGYITGITYTPVNISAGFSGVVNLGNKITFTTEDGDTVSSYVMADSMSGTQMINQTITATGQRKRYRVADRVDAIENRLNAIGVAVTELGNFKLVYTKELYSQSATITNIIGSMASFDRVITEILDAGYITAETLESNYITAKEIEASYVTFNTLETDYLTANRIEADYLSTANAELSYAKIDFANIDTAAFKKLFVDTGIIKEAIISEGHVTGVLDSVTVNADSITTGTLKADRLELLGKDGLYYKLNTSGETVEAQQTEQNALHGSHIISQSITANKIYVDDLYAFGATIGGIMIEDNAMISSNGNFSLTKEGVLTATEGRFAYMVADDTGLYFTNMTKGLPADQFKTTHITSEIVSKKAYDDEGYDITKDTVRATDDAPDITLVGYKTKPTAVTYIHQIYSLATGDEPADFAGYYYYNRQRDAVPLKGFMGAIEYVEDDALDNTLRKFRYYDIETDKDIDLYISDDGECTYSYTETVLDEDGEQKTVTHYLSSKKRERIKHLSEYDTEDRTYYSTSIDYITMAFDKTSDDFIGYVYLNRNGEITPLIGFFGVNKYVSDYEDTSRKYKANLILSGYQSYIDLTITDDGECTYTREYTSTDEDGNEVVKQEVLYVVPTEVYTATNYEPSESITYVSTKAKHIYVQVDNKTHTGVKYVYVNLSNKIVDLSGYIGADSLTSEGKSARYYTYYDADLNKTWSLSIRDTGTCEYYRFYTVVEGDEEIEYVETYPISEAAMGMALKAVEIPVPDVTITTSPLGGVRYGTGNASVTPNPNSYENWLLYADDRYFSTVNDTPYYYGALLKSSAVTTDSGKFAPILAAEVGQHITDTTTFMLGTDVDEQSLQLRSNGEKVVEIYGGYISVPVTAQFEKTQGLYNTRISIDEVNLDAQKLSGSTYYETSVSAQYIDMWRNAYDTENAVMGDNKAHARLAADRLTVPHFTAKSSATAWINTTTDPGRAVIYDETEVNKTSYFPFYTAKSLNNHTVSMGRLGDAFYLVSLKSDRTENGYDYGAYFDLGTGEIFHNGSLVLYSSNDTAAASYNKPPLVVGSKSTGYHLEFDGNEIMAKANETTTSSLYINNDGGDVVINNNASSGTLQSRTHIPVADATFSLGSANRRWTGVYLTGHIYMSRADTEQQIRFEDCSKSSWNCYLYKGSGNSTTVVGLWDGTNGSVVWYYTNAKQFAIGKDTTVVSSYLSVAGSIGATTTKTTIGRGGIELYHPTPFIDFHYNNTQTDYSYRIIAESDGLAFKGAVKMNSTLTASGVYNSTGTGTAVVVNSSGKLMRNSSSRRYKEDIEDLNIKEVERLYDVPVRTFKYKEGVLDKDDELYDKRIPGLIAEEVAEVLPEAVVHNENGQVEMWNSLTLVPIMVKLIQENHKEIQALKKQLAALK